MVLDGPGNARQLNRAITDRRYSTADERSRARKGADGRDSGSRSRVCTTHTGAQWTARPTLTLRLSVSAVKRSRARKGADGRVPAKKPGLH